MKKIIEEIKYGFGIAVEELILFVGKLVACLYLAVLPLAISTSVPLLVWSLLLLCEVDYTYELLVFKILFSLFQILALSMSMSMVEHDEQVPGNSAGKEFVPSKDLVIAIYVIINVYIWGFL